MPSEKASLDRESELTDSTVEVAGEVLWDPSKEAEKSLLSDDASWICSELSTVSDSLALLSLSAETMLSDS